VRRTEATIVRATAALLNDLAVLTKKSSAVRSGYIQRAELEALEVPYVFQLTEMPIFSAR